MWVPVVATYEPTRWFVTILFLAPPPGCVCSPWNSWCVPEGYAKTIHVLPAMGVLSNLVLDVLLIGVLRMGAAGLRLGSHGDKRRLHYLLHAVF